MNKEVKNKPAQEIYNEIQRQPMPTDYETSVICGMPKAFGLSSMDESPVYLMSLCFLYGKMVGAQEQREKRG